MRRRTGAIGTPDLGCLFGEGETIATGFVFSGRRVRRLRFAHQKSENTDVPDRRVLESGEMTMSFMGLGFGLYRLPTRQAFVSKAGWHPPRIAEAALVLAPGTFRRCAASMDCNVE